MSSSNLKKVMGWVFIFLLGIGAGVGGVWLFLSYADALFYLREKIIGETPPAQVDVYVQAIIQGNRSVAANLWYLDDSAPDSAKYAALKDRRATVTDELLQHEIQSEYLILRTEWWTTCCEPGVTCDSRSAGGARLSVQFLDSQGDPIAYVFDVFTQEQPYWGAAMGYPPRHWVIRDIYPSDQEPLYWLMIYEPHIRSVEQQGR